MPTMISSPIQYEQSDRTLKHTVIFTFGRSFGIFPYIIGRMPFFCYRKTIRSITTDNGSEFCAHKLISKALAPKGSKNPNLVFFADSYSSWQKGAIENANKLIRQYIPKGTDFSSLTDAFILKIQIKSTEDLAKNSILDPLARFSSSKSLILHLPVESRMWGLWQCICRKSPFFMHSVKNNPDKMR